MTVDRIVETHILTLDTSLVEDFISFENEQFNYDNIENLYEDDEGEEPKDIFEWWRISDWLATQLKQLGESILENDYGVWWGRGCCGQAIAMDSVIKKIAKQIG